MRECPGLRLIIARGSDHRTPIPEVFRRQGDIAIFARLRDGRAAECVLSSQLHFPGSRDARRLSCSPLLNGKFLDTVIEGVHDKEVAVTVEGQPVWGKEFTRFGPFRSEAAQVLALGGEPLNATAYRADPDPVVLVDT